MSRNKLESGFSLIEVLIVLLIFSLLSVMMVYTTSNARQIGTSTQNFALANQNARLIVNIMERDMRQIGAGVFEVIYKRNNGGFDNEKNNSTPDSFRYEMVEADLDGFMVPPVEVNNGTDSAQQSYLMPLQDAIDLVPGRRELSSDLITIYYTIDSGFSGKFDGALEGSEEALKVTDQVTGKRVEEIFTEVYNSAPQLVFISEDAKAYSTLRVVNSVVEVGANEYHLFTQPINGFNQPETFKEFLDSANKSGDLNDLIKTAKFKQINAISYFLYNNTAESPDAEGWLIRLDWGSVVATGALIDCSDPETLRPYVVAEHVADFQVALGIDSDQNGIIDNSEWINDENMETYVHLNPGSGSTSAEYLNLVNNLRAIRCTVVSHTDASAENDPFGFPDPDDANFYNLYPTVNEVADKIGITPTLEDRVWSHSELVDRLWYRKAVQLTKSVIIRNMDLENTFARENNQ
jgi:prepilin-type N-terminal cleavage/methylation domain-containing protein